MLKLVVLFLLRVYYCRCGENEDCDAFDNLVSTEVYPREEVKALRVFDLKIPILCDGSVRNLIHLNLLVLSNNTLKDIQPGALRLAPNNITDFHLVNNELSVIKKGVFNGLYIVNINLTNNQIETVEAGAFENMSQLHSLEMTKNHLKSFSPNWFGRTGANLLRLMLEDNYIRAIQDKAFDNIFNSTNEDGLMIHFSKNVIGSIHPGAFRKLTRCLLDLDFSDNHLSRLRDNLFLPTHYVWRMNLSRNLLTCLSERFLANFRVMFSVDVTYNAWDERCWTKLVDWAKSRRIYFNVEGRPRYSFYIEDETHNTRANESDPAWVEVEYLKKDPMELRSHYSENQDCEMDNFSFASSSCNVQFLVRCNTKISNASMELDNLGISNIEPGAFRTAKELLVLHLERNQLTTIKKGVFYGLNKLLILNVSSNKIETIESGVFDGMEKLFDVNLSHNKLKQFDPKWFGRNAAVKELLLNNNYIQYIPERAFRFIISERPEDHLLISLSDNVIKDIHPKAFRGMSPCRLTLSLKNNRLSELDEKLFAGFSDLFEIDLSNNTLTCLTKNFFDDFVVYSKLVLCHNPWEKVCWTKMVKWMKNTKQKIKKSSKPHFVNN